MGERVGKSVQGGWGKCHCISGINSYGTQILTKAGGGGGGGKSKSKVQEERWHQVWQRRGKAEKTPKGESGIG